MKIEAQLWHSWNQMTANMRCTREQGCEIKELTLTNYIMCLNTFNFQEYDVMPVWFIMLGVLFLRIACFVFHSYVTTIIDNS